MGNSGTRCPTIPLLSRRKELWDKQQAEERVSAAKTASSGKSFPTRSHTTTGSARGTNPKPKGFAADTAEKTGLSKRRINQLLAEPKPRGKAPAVAAPVSGYDVLDACETGDGATCIQAMAAAGERLGYEQDRVRAGVTYETPG